MVTGQWRQDGPSTPDRIKTGANSTLDKMRGGKSVVIAVGAVAVVLVAALIWVTMSFGRSDPAPAADDEPTQSEESATELESGEVTGILPDGNYQIGHGERCLGLAEHGEVDRWVIANRDCDAQQTYLSVTFVAEDTIRVEFIVEGFTEFCLRADGPELDDDSAKEDDLYYFAPYDCDPADKLQEFTLAPLDEDMYQIHTAAGQCMEVFQEWGFPDGDGVGTAPCESADAQTFQFNAL